MYWAIVLIFVAVILVSFEASLTFFELEAKTSCDGELDAHPSSSVPYYRTSTAKQASTQCCRRCLSPPEPRGALVARQWHTLLSPAAAQAW